MTKTKQQTGQNTRKKRKTKQYIIIITMKIVLEFAIYNCY